MKLQTCFGDVFFLYIVQFLTIQKVYITKLPQLKRNVKYTKSILKMCSESV